MGDWKEYIILVLENRLTVKLPGVKKKRAIYT